MTVTEIILRYQAGVRFRCGCEEGELHPAVQRALLAGRLRPADLLRCPVHRQPLELDERQVTASS
jgi:hypothetical protein